MRMLRTGFFLLLTLASLWALAGNYNAIRRYLKHLNPVVFNY